MTDFIDFEDLQMLPDRIRRRATHHDHVALLREAGEPRTIDEIEAATDGYYEITRRLLKEIHVVWLCRDRIESGELIYWTPAAWATITDDGGVVLHDDPDCDHLGIVDGHRPATGDDLDVGAWCAECDASEPTRPTTGYQRLEEQAKEAADD